MIRTHDRVVVGDPNAVRITDRPALPVATWEARALCRQVDPELFYAEGDGAMARTAEAKKVCQRCPVRLECLQRALDDNERYGVWGGMSERERLNLQRPNAPHQCEWPGCVRGFSNRSALSQHMVAHRRKAEKEAAA